MARVPAPMTGNRVAVLRMLDELGGIESGNLTRGQKQIGSSLQRDGYAVWCAGAGSTRHSLIGQTLRITDAGREALAAATK